MSRATPALLVLALVACSSKGDAPPSPQPASRPGGGGAPPADAAPPPAPAFAPPPAAPGPAYIDAGGKLAVILPDGTAARVTDIAGYLQNLCVGADGKAYAATTVEVGHATAVELYRIEGAAATKLTRVTKATTTTAITADRAGVVYVAQNEIVFRFDGTLTALPSPGALVDDLAVTADNQVVAGTMQGKAFVLAGDAWQPLDLTPLGEVPSYTSVWVVGGGAHVTVGVRHGKAHVVQGGALAPAPGDVTLGPTRPARATSGLLAYVDYEDGRRVTHLVTPAGATAASPVVPADTSSLAIDGRARLWWVHDGTLVVASATGAERTEYAIGTLPALAGAERNADDDLIVLGAGPATLPAIGAVEVVGRITGTLRVKGAPLADTEIEICTFAGQRFQVSPCADSTARRAARTNGRGEFVFEDVPVGKYAIAFKQGGRWAIAVDTWIFAERPGPSLDMGTLDYAPVR